MKISTKLAAIALFSAMTQCGQGHDQAASELSDDNRYFFYCVDTTSGKWMNVNGQLMQKFLCGGGNVHTWVEGFNSFSEGQAAAQRACRLEYGNKYRLGNAGNAGPGVAGGDLTPSFTVMSNWLSKNCYESVD